jgi:hypothetical protein
MPRLVSVLGLTLIAAACSSGGLIGPALSPPETFDWIGQPMKFSPPPAGWRREGGSSNGTKGVGFIKTGSAGEGITLGDYYLLADRHRSTYLRKMIAGFETYEDGGFAWDKALRGAYAHTDSPFSPLEAEIAERINTEVGEAGMAFRNRDRSSARAHLEAALVEADRLRYSLADVLERVEFKPERRQQPEWYQLLGRRETTIAGEPAVVVDYTVKVPERMEPFAAREAYVVHNSHLFIVTFIGLTGNLSVFDAVVSTIQFPT